jgi:nicotinate-nucleotide adenylyltransferase
VAQLQLDVLHVVPTGQAWHKAATLSAPVHRLRMAQLAFAHLPASCVDACELQRAGPTYTIDTLETLREAYPQAHLFLIIGADQATHFERWHRWRSILELAQVVVAQRPDQAPLTGVGAQWHNSALESALALDLPPMAVSATAIRQRIAQGERIDTWVPAPVAQYIEQQALYRATHD